MKGYDNANGDSRGILERFLPTVFRKSTDGTPTHNAILGAIKQAIETTRDELASMSYEVYFTKATGKFLDLYGKYIGLDRLELEDDDTYRGRLLSYVKTQRGTISAIVDGIRSDLGKDVNVSVYETWRNIFILNKSNLNGLDYIMGKKYRYGVIEITLDTYVDNGVLQSIVNKYKAHGVLVYYKYSLGGTSNIWDLKVDNTEKYFLDGDDVLGDKQQVYFKNMKTYLADSPITVSDLDLFKTNTSDLNGSDVLSGNPSNAYIYDKTKSPYFHLIGYVPDNVSVESYPDVYDYVYKNNRVIPGGRNLVLNSSGLSGSSTLMPTLKGATSSNGGAAILTYPEDGILMTNRATNTTTEWYYQVANAWTPFSGTPLVAGNTYTFSADVMGTVPQAVLRWGFNGGAGGGGEYSRNFNINNTSWTRVSITTTPLPSNTGMYWRIQGGINNQYSTGWTGGETLKFRNVKLEQGNMPTPWTPAPEDNDHSMDVYRFGTAPYITLSKEDNNAYTFTPDVGSSPAFAFNMSRILANNGYNDQVKNFSSNQVTEIGIHTKGSETGLPNTTVTAKGNTGTPISGSFQDTNPNKLFNTEFKIGLDGWLSGLSGTSNTAPWIPQGNTKLQDDKKWSVSDTGVGNILIDSLSSFGNNSFSSYPILVMPGQKLTASIDARSSLDYSGSVTVRIDLRYYDSNMNYVSMKQLQSGVLSDWYTFITSDTVPSGVSYVSYNVLTNGNLGYNYYRHPCLTFSDKPLTYVPGYDNDEDKRSRLQYEQSTDSSGDYTYSLSTPSQVSSVSLDDYYPYGRSKRVITASGSGVTVPLGIFDTQTTPTMSVPNYSTLNKDTITRYVDSIYVNTDVPLSELRIYNFTTQRWESVPTDRFNVGNYLKDSISIPGSYLLIKSTVNTIKYLDIDVTLLNLGVTQ